MSDIMKMDKSKGFQEVRERFASMKQERRNIMKRIGKGILALMNIRSVRMRLYAATEVQRFIIMNPLQRHMVHNMKERDIRY